VPGRNGQERQPRGEAVPAHEVDPNDRPVWRRAEPKSVDALLLEAGIEQLHAFQISVRQQAAQHPERDVLIEAPTGSGKTLAYALLALDDMERLGLAVGPPAALIIAPTRELAQQVDQVLLPYARGVNRRVGLLQGGVAYEPQLRNLARGADLVVGTPGRLLDMLERRQLDLEGLAVVVIDEADRLADMGFLEDVDKILDAVPVAARVVLVSATLDRGVAGLMARMRPNPIAVQAAGDVGQAPEGLGLGTQENPHRRLRLTREFLRSDLGKLLDASSRSLVFVRTRHSADRWAGWIEEDGRTALALHGGLTPGARLRAITAFRNGEVPVLVATDLAARGLDVAGVELVAHLERSDDERDYIHRSGRTGRAGKRGVVVNFVRKETLRPVLAMEARLGVLVADATIPEVVRLLDGLADQRSGPWHPPLGRTTQPSG
jgi:superfamily II DNA/RNA helicase